MDTVVASDDSKLVLNKKRKKWPFVLLLFVWFAVIGVGVYFFIQAQNKDKTYVAIGADLVSTEKVYETGRPYYVGKYKYVVDDKTYYYSYDKKFEGDPDKVIQVKYNPSKPSVLYNSNEAIFYTIVFCFGGVMSLVTIGILLSITSKRAEKIVIAVVEDTFTCVGGRKIYFRTLDENGAELPSDKVEYYSYFTDKFDQFPIGKKVKFNIFKYSEVLPTDVYKGVEIKVVNELKIDDFIFLS